jgi:hypothetical protein
MKRYEFEQYIDLVVLPMCEKIRSSKGKNYSGQDDCLANFKRTGEALHLDPMVVLMVFLTKHMDAIASYVSGKYLDDGEPIEFRIYDAINYLFLLLGLIQEKKNGGNNEADIPSGQDNPEK